MGVTEAMVKGGAAAAALVTFSTAIVGTGLAWTAGCFGLFAVLTFVGFSLESRRINREAHRELELRASQRRGKDW